MDKSPKAFKSGIINLHFTSIPCAVLKDGTRLITTSGLQKALGRANPSGGKNVSAVLPSFLNVQALKPFIDNDLMSSLSPIEFYMLGGGKAFGYKAEVLPQVCDVFLKAREAGVLTEKQLKHAASADLIIRSLAKIGIIGLVDEATGYQEFRDKTALQALLDKYLSAECAKWAKTFPDKFYMEIFRLKNWNPTRELRHKPGAVAHITNDLVYKRMAPELLNSLEDKNPINDQTGRRKNCHHQHLTREQGINHLKGHLFMLQRLMKMANNWEEFMKMVNDFLPYSTTESIQIPEIPN